MAHDRPRLGNSLAPLTIERFEPNRFAPLVWKIRSLAPPTLPSLALLVFPQLGIIRNPQ